MASDQIVAAVLAFLHELYPTREIGPETLDAWAITFAEWDDATLQACVRQAAATPGRKFFPTPGEIATYRPLPAVDAPATLRRISALGTYTATGWIYPGIEAVREALGEPIAAAYAAAGAERCFADDGSVTQDIARRAFAEEMRAAQLRLPNVPLLAAATRRALGAGQSPAGTP